MACITIKQAARVWGFLEHGTRTNREALLRSWATRGIDHSSAKTKPLLIKLALAFHRSLDDLWKPYPDEDPVANLLTKWANDLAGLTADQKFELATKLHELLPVQTRMQSLIEQVNVAIKDREDETLEDDPFAAFDDPNFGKP